MPAWCPGKRRLDGASLTPSLSSPVCPTTDCSRNVAATAQKATPIALQTHSAGLFRPQACRAYHRLPRAQIALDQRGEFLARGGACFSALTGKALAHIAAAHNLHNF